VAVDASHIYWAEPYNIGRANLDGGSPKQSFIAGAHSANGVAVDDSHVYWANFATGSIGRANLDGSSPNENFITGASSPNGVAVDGSHIYWVNVGSNSIGRANLDGSSPDQNFITGASSPLGLAVAVPPSSIAPPTIGGAAVQGQTLTEAHGSWVNSPTSFAYQWLRCDASGASCAVITGATTQTCRLGAADVGFTLRVQEVASNIYGSGSPATSLATSVVRTAPPPRDPTAITLTTSLNPSAPQQAVTLTAQVIDTASLSTVPSGRVRFLAGTRAIGAATLDARGFASLRTRSLRGPEQSLTATYLPSAAWLGSVSAAYDQLILPPSAIVTPHVCTARGALLPVKITHGARVRSVSYYVDVKLRTIIHRAPTFKARLSTRSLKRGHHRLSARLRYNTSHAATPRRLLSATFRVC
jgi:Bacterial Ig-like domain (group 3)